MITLTKRLTTKGIVCENDVLGKIATIVRETTLTGGNGSYREWFVRPYGFPIYERGVAFKSLTAAETYVLALAYEMAEMHPDHAI